MYVKYRNEILGNWIGGNIKFLFLMATIILIISVTVTVTSFKEIPLDLMEKINKKAEEENKNVSLLIKFTLH